MMPTTDSNPPAAGQTMKLLHLGCERTAPPQWVNVDGSWNAWLAQSPRLKKILAAFHLLPKSQSGIDWPTNIVIADLRKKLPFPDASFDVVYSSHMLEHLHRTEALALLRESLRVLKPGGRGRNLVPDLGSIVRDYVTRTEDPNEVGIVPARRMIGRLGMRGEFPAKNGWLYRTYSNMTDFHSHKWMYDEEALKNLMEEAGFAECQPRQYLQSTIPYLEKVELQMRAEGGAIVEGIKPPAP